MIARLVRSADFERVLRTRSWMSSMHFAIHHLAEAPRSPIKRPDLSDGAELSTASAIGDFLPVDDCIPVAPDCVWLGAVLPKRHARRSVTRSLLKRQIRTVVDRSEASLPRGLWVVRLRAPFDRTQFLSAASDALKQAARAELEWLIGRAAQRTPVDGCGVNTAPCPST